MSKVFWAERWWFRISIGWGKEFFSCLDHKRETIIENLWRFVLADWSFLLLLINALKLLLASEDRTRLEFCSDTKQNYRNATTNSRRQEKRNENFCNYEQTSTSQQSSLRCVPHVNRTFCTKGSFVSSTDDAQFSAISLDQSSKENRGKLQSFLFRKKVLWSRADSGLKHNLRWINFNPFCFPSFVPCM